MLIENLIFPVVEYETKKGPIILRNNEIELYSFSKGAEKTFNRFFLIDASGKMFKISRVVIVGRAPMIMCIRWLQKMNKVEFHGEHIKDLTLIETKQILTKHIKG